MANFTQRVLFYYFAFPHYRLTIFNEICDQAKQNHAVEVAFAAGVKSREGIKVLRSEEFPALQELSSRSFGPLTWQKKALGLGAGKKYDAVVLGPALSSINTWLILVLRRLGGRRTYLWGQCGRPGDRSPRRYAQEIMNRMATSLMVYGQSEARAAQELGLSSKKIHVVNNATDSNAQALRLDYGLFENAVAKTVKARAAGELRILHLGRVVSWKRINVLLEAARALRVEYPQVSVDIVGGGDALESLRTEFNESFIRFHGEVYEKDRIADFLSEATVVCSPFHMGLVAVDALRAGVPVMIPDNSMNASEVEALTPGVNSKYFSAGDPIALAKAVEAWLKEFPDVTSEQYLEARARELAIWDPSNVARQILKIVSGNAVMHNHSKLTDGA